MLGLALGAGLRECFRGRDAATGSVGAPPSVVAQREQHGAPPVRVSSVDVDINRLVRAAEHDAAELVQIIEGIGSEEEFTQMHDESISTVLPALCDAVSAELDAELVSLKDVLRKVAAMIMACDNYPDTTRQRFEHWGAMVSPLTIAPQCSNRWRVVSG